MADEITTDGKKDEYADDDGLKRFIFIYVTLSLIVLFAYSMGYNRRASKGTTHVFTVKL